MKCVRFVCLVRGGVSEEGGEWMRGLGLDFTNPVRIGGVLEVCLGCGGIGGEWVGGLDQGLEGWCYVCEMWVWIICGLCLADTCTSEEHPVFNPVTPYGYLLPNMHLFIGTGTQFYSLLLKEVTISPPIS